MGKRRGFWSELHRNSRWIQRLGDQEKHAVLLALEARDPEGSAKSRAVITFGYLVFIYGGAASIWGLAFRTSLVGFLIGGIILGALAGAIAATVIASQKTLRAAQDMQLAAWASWGNVGLLAGVVGLAVLGARAIFFP
jgi:hypothetical protein